LVCLLQLSEATTRPAANSIVPMTPTMAAIRVVSAAAISKERRLKSRESIVWFDAAAAAGEGLPLPARSTLAVADALTGNEDKGGGRAACVGEAEMDAAGETVGVGWPLPEGDAMALAAVWDADTERVEE
jgi:hypothetical protein